MNQVWSNLESAGSKMTRMDPLYASYVEKKKISGRMQVLPIEPIGRWQPPLSHKNADNWSTPSSSFAFHSSINKN